MLFGEKVKLLRQTLGLSQSMLAKELGLSKRTIQSYEAGKSYPKQRQLYQQMAELFGTDINYLLMENEDISGENDKEEPLEKDQPLLPEEEADLLAESIGRLFLNPDLPAAKKDELMQRIQMAYWDAKRSTI
jgi:transcriptional regulator with XRE-family HTH domain